MRRLVALVVLALLVGCGGDSDDDSDASAGGRAGGTVGSRADAQAGGRVGDDSGRTDPGGEASDCSPSAGTTVSVTASGTAFDKSCLAAPANQAFTINYDNKDALPHNIAILESRSATEALFKADTFVGPAVKTLSVKALEPGTYAFRCEVHPGQMSGTFVVK